jgi:chromosome segregation ATPase
MIAKLVKEAQEEAEEKAYCDAEMAKTEKKKEELTDDLEAITAKIDKSISASKTLKKEVKNLQEELLELEKMQEEMDTARKDAHAAFLDSSGDLQKGLDGLRKALKVLRDYYAKDEESASLMQTDDSDSKFDDFMQQPAAPEKHQKSSGAGDSIIGMLEVAESDFAKNLAEEQQEEDAAQTEYEKLTQENKVTKASKEQDVKYKTKEFKALDKSVTELSSDRDGMNTELDAVLEYYDKIKEKCVAKPEPYEERKKRREAEIAGLKNALSILEGEAVFIQRH